MDDAMDGSRIKRRSVKDITKKDKKKKSKDSPPVKRIFTHEEKKQKKIQKKTKKNIKKITKGFGNLKANDSPKKKKKSEVVEDEDGELKTGKGNSQEILDAAWSKAIEELSELPSTSPFHQEILKKCKGHRVPRTLKSKFIDWIDQHLLYSRAIHYSQLKTLYQNIKKHYEISRPQTKTYKRRLEKKRNKVRKQILAQSAKADQPLDEKALLKRKMKHMKKKEKLKKKKLELMLKKKGGIKNKGDLSEEKKNSLLKEIKKSKKTKKIAKKIGSLRLSKKICPF